MKTAFVTLLFILGSGSVSASSKLAGWGMNTAGDDFTISTETPVLLALHPDGRIVLRGKVIAKDKEAVRAILKSLKVRGKGGALWVGGGK